MTSPEHIEDQKPLSIENFREKIMEVQEAMMATEGTKTGEALDKVCPLKHSFGDGLYIREIFMPAGITIISKIHKRTHPYFVMQGSASVITEEGVVLIEAPFNGITKAGTKRALYIHTDSIWITVHKTNKTDLKEIEEEVIAKDFEEVCA